MAVKSKRTKLKLGTNQSSVYRQACAWSAELRLRESIDLIIGVWKFLP